MLAFQEPTFQRELHECCQYERGSVQYRKAVLRLVRSQGKHVCGPCGGVVFAWAMLEKTDSDLNLKVDWVGISSTEQPLQNYFFCGTPKIRNTNSVH